MTRAIAAIMGLVLAMLVRTAGAGEPQGNREEGLRLWREAREAHFQGRLQDAVRGYEAAYRAYSDPGFKYNLGHAQRLLGNYDQALTAYEFYRDHTPRPNPDIHTHIGDCLLLLQRRGEANAAFRRYLELQPNGPYAAYTRRAIEEGIPIEQQIRRDPATARRAQALYDQGLLLIQRGQYAQAAEMFIRGYGPDATVHELLLNAGSCYQQARMWTEAVGTFRRYLRTPGAENRARAFLAECLHHAGQQAEAVQAYRDYLDQEPNGEYSRGARDYIYSLTQGRTDGSIAVPSDEARQRAVSAFSRGMEHHQAGRHREALREFTSSHDAMPTRHALFMLAFTYEQLSQWQEALTRYEILLRGGDYDDDAVAHLNAAECLLRLNRPGDAEGEARAYIRRAEEADLPDERTNLESARTLLRICEERRTSASAD